jgi:hypothetical protein
MLKVGFSAALELGLNCKLFVPAFSNMLPVMPAVVWKLNVAAMLGPVDE